MDRAPFSFKDRNCSALPVVAVGVIALASGIYHQSAGALAIGIALAALPAAVYAILKRSLEGIAVRRIAPESAFEGDSVAVRLVIENGSRWPLFQPLVSDCFRPDLRGQKDVRFPERIRPGETIEASYEGACILRRGIYAIGPLAVTLSDPFGWFELRKLIDDRVRIKVFPSVLPIEMASEVGQCLSRITSENMYRGPGESQEFFAVRDYQRGDPLRRIHWGLTAHRGGYPVIREFSKSAAGDFHLFIDAHRRSLIGVGRGSSLEHAVKIVAGVAAHGLARGHRVRVIAGTASAARIEKAAGKRHLRQVLDLLVRLRPHDGQLLPEILESHAAGVRPGSTVLVGISPALYHEAAVEKQLRAWRSRGARVLAVIFDASSFRRLWSDTPASESSRAFAARMREAGIRAYVLPCAADLRAVLSGEPR